MEFTLWYYSSTLMKLMMLTLNNLFLKIRLKENNKKMAQLLHLIGNLEIMNDTLSSLIDKQEDGIGTVAIPP